MVVVVGPCLSLSASGLIGKALLFYDSKLGARIRSPKKSFVPPGQAWEVNKTWFKLASDRWKSLNEFQKRAWNHYSVGLYDVGRDYFMGRQIEMWNLSPLNNVSWPPVSSPELPTPPQLTFTQTGWWPVNIYNITTQSPKIELWENYKDEWQKSIVGVRWYRVYDSDSPPLSGNLWAEVYSTNYTFFNWAGHWSNYWYEFIRWDGTYTDLTKAFKVWQN